MTAKIVEVLAKILEGLKDNGSLEEVTQHLNLEKMVGHGSGLMLSRKYFNQESLLSGIKSIFEDYKQFLENAQNLSTKLPKPVGDKNAVKRILEIAKNHDKWQK